jgi:molybdopterin molybdotransferase
VPQALATLGAEVLFHKLAIRPGKPLLCARLPDGALFFGLPGNPMATATGLRFFVEPALRAMLGLPPEQPLRVPLVSGFRSDKPVRLHLKARLETGGEGRLHIRLLPGQESYRIRTLTQANAWAVVPVGRGEFAPGDLVDVFGLGHLDILSSFFDGSAECPDGQKPCRP